jgi:hypothetical protein
MSSLTWTSFQVKLELRQVKLDLSHPRTSWCIQGTKLLLLEAARFDRAGEQKGIPDSIMLNTGIEQSHSTVAMHKLVGLHDAVEAAKG